MPEKRVWRENEKRLLWTFNGIRYRFNIEKCEQHDNYWWRVIMCECETFEDFYQDMSLWYEPWLSIDRIDNNWNYNKENCRWLTVSQNSRKADKDYIPDWDLFQVKKRPFDPLDVLFDKSWINIKWYCGEKRWESIEKTIDWITIYTYWVI